MKKRLLAGDPINTIAKALGRSRTTIYAEKKRGTVVQIKQNKAVLMYIADCGQLAYERTRQGSFNTLKAGSIEPFLSWVENKVRVDKWSLDAAVATPYVRVCLYAMKWCVLKLYITTFTKAF